MTEVYCMCQEKKGGRGLARIEDYGDASIQEINVYLKKNKVPVV